MNTIPAKKFISLGNDRYFATEFGLSLRIWKREREGHFFCSFGSVLEVLYPYFITQRENDRTSFSASSGTDSALMQRVNIIKLINMDNRTSYTRTSE